MGLPWNSYEAYCFDQAASYWASYVEGELDKIGEKKTAKQKGLELSRQRRLKALLGTDDPSKKGQFADPALMFQ